MATLEKKPNGSDVAHALLSPPTEVKPEVVLSPEDQALAIMRKPFAPHQISKMCKPTKKDNPAGRCNACGGFHKLPAVQLSYVGHAALTDRLLDADPKWTWEPLALATDGTPLLDKDGGMWIKLTVAGVTRLGYGDAQGKQGGDATKERIGDALRNAAMRFGAALELWHKGDLHATAPVVEPLYEDDTEPQGMPGDRIAELCEWISNAKDADELKKMFAMAFKEAGVARDNAAIKEFSRVKDRRKQELGL